MNKLTKTTIACSIILGLAGCNQAATEVAEKPSSRPVQVMELTDLSVTGNKQFNGTVQAQETASIAFRVAGTVEKLFVKKGDSIKKGQVIAQLDPHDYQVALEELYARMLEAKSAHKLANAELKRVKQATEDDAIASINLDRAISGYERSLSAIKVVEKNIQRAKDTLRYTKLRAPFDGVVGELNIEEHEQVAPGISVASVHQEGLMEVDIDVPENLVSHFSLGQDAAVSWYMSSVNLPAKVTEIAAKPNNIKQTYTVTLAVDSLSSELFVGKAVTVRTRIAGTDDQYCVPYSALIGEKTDMHINVIRQNTVLTQPVSLQSINATQACVDTELKSGDYIVVSGSNYLKQGETITNIQVKRD